MNQLNQYYPFQMPWQLSNMQQPLQNMQPLQNIQPQQQIQNGGFIVVHSEEEALRYPVAPGNSVTFKVENQPLVIEKTMGFSQLESPRIERFRLVREEVTQQPVQQQEIRYALADDLEKLRQEFEAFRGQPFPIGEKKIDERASHFD